MIKLLLILLIVGLGLALIAEIAGYIAIAREQNAIIKEVDDDTEQDFLEEISKRKRRKRR